jgi:transcriptional regulator with XRE-family HTH domain
MNLCEIGKKIQSERKEAGLLQEQLARLAGLSRVTVNQLENGTLNDIGYTKLNCILDILGMTMEMNPKQKMQNALAVAARTISTSYKDIITAEVLAQIFRSGIAPKRYHAHLMTLLDETPLPLVLKAVQQAATIDAPTKKILRNLHNWSQEWQTHRTVF